MAALGTIANVYPAPIDRPTPTYSVSLYKIHRGLQFGPLTLGTAQLIRVVVVVPLSNYVIRQIRIIFKQLWPIHGQRFPQ